MCVPQTIVIASRNPGKVAELRAILVTATATATWGVADVRGIADFPGSVEPDETGSTYLENARIKAVQAARETGLPALGDDSGIEVDALDGRPGLHSARYGGPGLSAADRVARLLAALDGVAEDRRGAAYRAVAVLAWPDGATIDAAGECRGRIAVAPRGTHGFGYDPVFIYPETGLTFAETEPAKKARLDHRGRAMRALHAEVLRACATRGGAF